MRVTSLPPVLSATSKGMLRDTATAIQLHFGFAFSLTQLKTETHQFKTKLLILRFALKFQRWILLTYSLEKCFKAAGSFKLQILSKTHKTPRESIIKGNFKKEHEKIQ